jgi:putative SOS response-associated peptidase YedK
MCGRSTITKLKIEIQVRFDANFFSDDVDRYHVLPNYNVAPTNLMPVIVEGEPRIIKLYRWGLIPAWAKDTKIGSSMINARIESLHEKPAFRNLISSQRCILPLDGFYEWKRSSHGKIPYRIQTSDQEIFSVAGLWDQWRDSSNGEVVHSFTMITLAANEFMQQVHDRMPAILNPTAESRWLDATIPTKEVLEVIEPYASDKMKMYRVSDKVNNVRERGEELILPVEDGFDSKPTQLSLFD